MTDADVFGALFKSENLADAEVGLFGFNEAFEKVSSGFSFRERRALRRFGAGYRVGAFGRALRRFAVESGEFPFAADEDPSDTPIIDYWKWLIESGKIREFMTYLVTDFLPKLFELILMIVDALS